MGWRVIDLGEMIFECMQFRSTTQQWLPVFNFYDEYNHVVKNMTQVSEIVLSYWKLPGNC